MTEKINKEENTKKEKITEKEKSTEKEKNIETEKTEKKIFELPFVPLRGLTIFPKTLVHFDIGRTKSVKALDQAMASGKYMFVSTQKDDDIMLPSEDDYYKVGTVVKVKQMIKVKGDVVRVLVDGQFRAKIKKVVFDEPYLRVEVEKLEEFFDENKLVESEAALRLLMDQYEENLSLSAEKNIDEILASIEGMEQLGEVVDSIATQVVMKIENKQKLLEELDWTKRLFKLNEYIEEENQILKLEKKISAKVQKSISDSQKEFVLREQMKAIQSELDGGDDIASDVVKWNETLEKLKLPKKVHEKLKKEIKKYSRMQIMSQESMVVRNYIETVLDLPWQTSKKTNKNLKKAEKILNNEHYGLDKVKERIVEYLAVIHLSKAIKGPILCLVGPPGVGKTSVVKSIANATGRDFVRMSLGGVRDEAEIRGHRKTYIGSMPGRIINLIKEAGSNNPVFLFDEVDKIGADYKGDPADALLEVLDPEQNKDFTDHFLEVPFDLSKVIFVTTANTKDTIPRPLLDRMEIIDISGYTEEEKVKIANRYLIPKEIEQNGLKKDSVVISDNALSEIINYYTRESGVRNLQRNIAKICRKTAANIVKGKKNKTRITPSNIEKYLGKKLYRFDKVAGKNEVGVVTGMAWTEVGGDTLFVETIVTPGKGKLTLTGKLGDVMQESAKAAMGYIRSISDELGIKKDFYKNSDIHIHVPEGAVPKDGPSAGVTMFTSIVSALTGKPIKKDVAMTGEITLTGNILPVGGIKEKVLAAHRAGIKTILLPKDNEADIEEIPASARKDLKFILIEKAKDALKYAVASKKKGKSNENK